MKNDILVSIIIPNYNYGRYLRECLDSVLTQTYTNIEVIFRDNASTDDSFEIAMEYYPIFKKRGIYYSIHRNPYNVGSDKNTQLCLGDCRGELQYVLASDDSIEPTFIEKCVSVFENYPNVSMVMTHRKEVDENGIIMETSPFYNQNCIIDGESQAAVFMMAGIAIPGQRMCSRVRTARVRQFLRQWNVAGDWYNNFLYAMCGDIAYIKEPLCNYRVHSGNETTESEKNLTGVYEHYQLLNSFVGISKTFGMTKPASRYEEAVEKLGSMCLRYAYKMFRNNLNEIADKYLLLAPIFKTDIIHDNKYIELKKCVDLKGDELSVCLDKLFGDELIVRTKSYDPPEGFKILEL